VQRVLLSKTYIFRLRESLTIIFRRKVFLVHRHFNTVDFKNAMLSHGGIRDVRVSVVDASTVVDEGHAASNQVGRH